MQQTVYVNDVAQEPIYEYYVERQDSGQFDRYNADMQTFINYLWNRNLGVTVAMSHSGIGADVTNGFIQLICDNPIMQLRLQAVLTELRDQLPRDDQPTIEIRSKSVPRVDKPEWSEDITHYITVMLRTPRFRTKTQANEWWSKLAECVAPVAVAA